MDECGFEALLEAGEIELGFVEGVVVFGKGENLGGGAVDYVCAAENVGGVGCVAEGEIVSVEKIVGVGCVERGEMTVYGCG